MAKANYLVEGLSGVGKSSVHEELIRRGYRAISTDRAWSFYADPETGLRGGPHRFDTWEWDRAKALFALTSPEPEVLVVCGSGRNSDDFLPYFTKVFDLRIDNETMRRRLQARIARDWSGGHEAVDLMLRLNRSDERVPGAIDIDATKPLDEAQDMLSGRLTPRDAAGLIWWKASSTLGHPSDLVSFVALADEWDDHPEAREEIERLLLDEAASLVEGGPA
jgi:hypothetical protein